MVTRRLLNVLRSAGVGVGFTDVSDWADMLSLSGSAGVLRLGEYNLKLIDSALQAWSGKTFVSYPVHEYTYGPQQTPWLDVDTFKSRVGGAHTFIRIPLGHPIKANYVDGHVVSVKALTVPGEYDTDVTDSMYNLFPSGIDRKVEAVYAVVTSSEEDWSREAWRTGQLLTGERMFVNGMDKLTLVYVEGFDLQRFCDEGILGVLSVPVIDEIRIFRNNVEDAAKNVDKLDRVLDSVENSRCVLVALGDNMCCALYCSRVQTGEILDIRVCSGSGSTDVVEIDLDSGDTVIVLDLLALKEKAEGSEVFYVSDSKGYNVLSDEYGNILLGASLD